MVIAGLGEGEGEYMVMEGDLIFGDEHTIQCTNDVLWNYAPETCINLLASVTPVNAIKKGGGRNTYLSGYWHKVHKVPGLT